jgi:hypothetical protein
LIEENKPMTEAKSGRAKRSASDDDLLNEQFHTLLRDAAAKREERERTQSAEDAVTSKQASADLLALARDPARG